MLGKYRVVCRLGAGGMGVVYQATHVEIGKQVALKILSEHLAAGPGAQARFVREAAAASKISHPNVVKVTDYSAEGDVPFIVMELLRGEDLGVRLRHSPRGLPVEEVADVLLAACAGVFTAHQAGVVHRDLKPGNIFLAQTRLDEVQPKILDFGISKIEDTLLTAGLTDPGAIVGTAYYLSPEQATGRAVDHRADQYALGVVLYECLTGRRPFDGHTRPAIIKNIVEAALVPPSRLRPGLPRELEATVLRAMARLPDDRFPSVHALGGALLPFASPRQRIAWADYFGRDPNEASPPVASRSPSPERASPTEPRAGGNRHPHPHRRALCARGAGRDPYDAWLAARHLRGWGGDAGSRRAHGRVAVSRGPSPTPSAQALAGDDGGAGRGGWIADRRHPGPGNAGATAGGPPAAGGGIAELN